MKQGFMTKLSVSCRRLLSLFKAGMARFRRITETPLFKARIGAVFSAFILVVGVYTWGTIDNGLAWFAANKQVTAGSMETKLEDVPTVKANLRSYGIVKIDGQRYTAETAQQMYALPQHDPNEISYSQYKLALLVEIELWADQDIPIDIIVSTEHPDYSLESANVISNCVKLSSATFDAASAVAIKGGDSFAFTSVTTETNGATCTKVSDMKIYTGTATPEKQSIYFLMEYNKAFLDYINEYILFNRMDDPTVSYTNDLTFIIRKQE